MNHRPLKAVLALALLALAFSARSESPPAADKNFNLEERKQKQAWLWEAPRKQKIPTVKDTRWPLAEEDRFILERLEKAGLAPSPRADDRTWLRRVHFVITGLPPGIDEIQAFLSDTKAGASERVVDRLLASPHYGERWARHWMDLMRYAESRGHEGDYIIANAWHYRDYLIRAFNEDVPYDQFLTEHLAGDLLTKPRKPRSAEHCSARTRPPSRAMLGAPSLSRSTRSASNCGPPNFAPPRRTRHTRCIRTRAGVEVTRLKFPVSIKIRIS